MKQRAHAFAALALATLVVTDGVADELRWTAEALFERSVTSDVVLAEGAVVLQSGVLYEDDGPAAGFCYEPNIETLSGDVHARKTLVVPRPAARSATLLLAPGGELDARLNDEPLAWRALGKSGSYWRRFAIPPDALRAGANTFAFSGRGALWIAREEDYAAGSTQRPHHPNRSARSADGGRTWEDSRLGPDGTLDGEYYVRLFLDQYREHGSLLLPVVDLGDGDGSGVPRRLTRVGDLRILAETETPESTEVRLDLRSGTSYAPDESWSDWRPAGEQDQVAEPRGRYVQVRVRLATTDPLRTPVLRGLRLIADVESEEDWTGQVRVAESDNPEIVRSSIPFRYEPFDHPRLRQLRERIPADVVAAAQTEFNLVKALAKWSAVQWERGHLGRSYPAWDALEILAPHADGTPVGGFCQQHNVVFLQACEAFGIPGRAISLGPHDRLDLFRSGHEVVEVWSNEFRKWIYVDGDFAWYAVDPRTDVPLSLLELRDRQLALIDGREPAPFQPVHLLPDRERWRGLDERPPFLELRMIPRSNFLERRSPLPLHQGMRGWFWTGHHVWTDEAVPARPLYGHRVANRRNWSWTLNQAHVHLEPTGSPGTLRVHVDTVTPGFDGFVAAIDDSPAREVEPVFEWPLHAGANRLIIRPRNVAGREGIATTLRLDFAAVDTSD